MGHVCARYWIVRLRQLLKKVRKCCYRCKSLTNMAYAGSGSVGADGHFPALIRTVQFTCSCQINLIDWNIETDLSNIDYEYECFNAKVYACVMLLWVYIHTGKIYLFCINILLSVYYMIFSEFSSSLVTKLIMWCKITKIVKCSSCMRSWVRSKNIFHGANQIAKIPWPRDFRLLQLHAALKIRTEIYIFQDETIPFLHANSKTWLIVWELKIAFIYFEWCGFLHFTWWN
jgi:hypothetical protein